MSINADTALSNLDNFSVVMMEKIKTIRPQSPTATSGAMITRSETVERVLGERLRTEGEDVE